MILKSLILILALTNPEQDIKQLTVKPRPTGSEACTQARDYIRQSLDQESEIQEFRKSSYNIIATKEGVNNSDTIVVCAHYDSVSRSFGADDNASGTAAVVELSRRLKSKPLNNRILFILFSGEEQGMVGSEYFVRNYKGPKISFVINLDMIGHLKESNNGYTLPDISKTLSDLYKKYPFANGIMFKDGVGGASDHASFSCHTVFVHTGLHRYYHQPSDTIDTLNLSGIDKIIDCVYDFIISLDGKSDYDDLIKGLPVMRGKH
jgi:Iap family predicted aminopeptidase